MTGRIPHQPLRDSDFRRPVSPGHDKGGSGNREKRMRKLWRLTPAGIEAAAQLLPPERTMGGTAPGADRHGAFHAMAVYETILAFIQPRPAAEDIDQDEDGPLDRGLARPLDQGADQDVHETGVQVRPAGVGSIASWTTEVVLPVTGSVSAPAKGSPRPDAVLVAPEAEPALPFLCVEVDTGTETTAVVAAKFERYRRFFRRTVNEAPPGQRWPRLVPFCRTLYGDSGREGHPPVAVVFTGAGPRSLANRQEQLGELTRTHWAGQATNPSMWTGPTDWYSDYSNAIPIIVTTLDLLREHGPLGAVWWRYRHSGRETLANPDDKHAYNVRRQKRDDATDARRRVEEAEREASRPVCTSCGSEFSDARRSQVEIWQNDPHPGLCERCAAQAQRKEEEEKQRRAAEEASRRRFFGRRRG
ncbi:replication-relaxation family protein [Streptomyces sp. NPDC059853]|uniref:replication-relaxation family protein n=1 Tax=Streptomyces sp. NPDC059853 TaxID=3346973 RepID=UPI00365E0167